ncbi:MAG: DUF4097 family beta strand repeat protein [Clostridia bacterium]|nr:DUF4097 family beta strand repeat protein [Clostridia bacterium]
MKKSKRIILIVAAVCFFVGLVIIFSAYAANGFRFIGTFGSDSGEIITEKIRESFSKIEFNCDSGDLVIYESDDGGCTVSYPDSGRHKYTVEVVDGKLTVTDTDERNWFEKLFLYNGSSPVSVKLPKTEIDRISVSSLSGDITLSGGTFKEADINVKSGDIEVNTAVNKSVRIESTSGDIRIGGSNNPVKLSCEKLTIGSTSGDILIDGVAGDTDISVNSHSGDIYLDSSECGNLDVSLTSGDIDIVDFRVKDTLSINVTSGDVCFRNSDAGDIDITLTSGDVTGTLLTEKIFSCNTASGDISIPQTSGGGRCSIRTTSGDISLKIKDK